MKQMKSFLTLALALTALASCNKENEIPGMNPEVSGVPTYAAFSVKVNSTANTRATTPTDDNADAVEQTIGSLKVFVFNGGVLETTGDITLNAGNTGTTTLTTTTGPKEIYAVANAKQDMTLAVGKTLADFKKLAVKAGTTSATPDENIAATDAFVMIGKTDVTLTQQTDDEAKASPVAITVSRGAAKVNMQYNPATVVINTTALKGTFPEQPRYLVAQMNTHMFLSRQGYELTPNGAVVDMADATPQDGTYDHLTAIQGDMTGALVSPIAWNKSFITSLYTAENVNETPVTGNTTFVLVQIKYVPSAGDFAGTSTSIGGSGTFYVAFNKTTKTGAIYAAEAECDEAVALDAVNLVKKTYTNGLCYYRVNLRDISKTVLTEKYSVLRNHYYKINITQINSLGGNTTTDPDVVVPTDPETPLETETHISADITVEAWNAIIMNEPLG